jgi:hypothetical protein
MDLFHFPTRRRIIRVYILMMMMLFSVFPFLGVFSYWERERETPCPADDDATPHPCS